METNKIEKKNNGNDNNNAAILLLIRKKLLNYFRIQSETHEEHLIFSAVLQENDAMS